MSLNVNPVSVQAPQIQPVVVETKESTSISIIQSKMPETNLVIETNIQPAQPEPTVINGDVIIEKGATNPFAGTNTVINGNVIITNNQNPFANATNQIPVANNPFSPINQAKELNQIQKMLNSIKALLLTLLTQRPKIVRKNKWTSLNKPQDIREKDAQKLCKKLDKLNIPRAKVDKLQAVLSDGLFEDMKPSQRRKFERIMKRIEKASNSERLTRGQYIRLMKDIDKAISMVPMERPEPKPAPIIILADK